MGLGSGASGHQPPQRKKDRGSGHIAGADRIKTTSRAAPTSLALSKHVRSVTAARLCVPSESQSRNTTMASRWLYVV
jgi:hypothetical protein